MRVPFLTALLAIHPVAAIDASNGTPTTSSAPLVTSLNLTVEGQLLP